MARQVANVDITQDTFENWLLLTNELLSSLSQEIVTANSTYSNTGNTSVKRNSQLIGSFGANTITVTDELRGGNINSGYSQLKISTNTIIGNTTATNIVFQVANSTSLSYLTPTGSYFGNTASNSSLTSTAIILQTSATVNTNISATQLQVSNSTNTATVTPISFATGLFTGNTTCISVGANVVVNSTSLQIGNSTVNTVITQSQAVISNSTFTMTLTPFSLVTGNSTVNNSSNSTSVILNNGTQSVQANSTAVIVGNSTVNSTLTSSQLVIGNSSQTVTVTSNQINATAGVTFTSNVGIQGNTNFGQSNDLLMQVVVNNDIGSSTSANLVIYTFPKATYSSAKFIIQLKATGNTQISEAVLAHDGTDSYITTYATISAPASSNSAASLLGTFGANINGANCELLCKQTIGNSSVKIVAHLIK